MSRMPMPLPADPVLGLGERCRWTPPGGGYSERGRRASALAHAAGMTARNREVDVALIERPLPDAPGVRRQVAVNRRVDTLAHEKAQRRICHEEFRTGRAMQAVWEGQDGSHVAGADWSGGTRRSGITDGLSASEVLAIRRVVGARNAEELNAELVPVIGRSGLQELRAVLCGHGYFADLARAEGRSGERAASEIAGRFRWLLREATAALDAVGFVFPSAARRAG